MRWTINLGNSVSYQDSDGLNDILTASSILLSIRFAICTPRGYWAKSRHSEEVGLMGQQSHISSSYIFVMPNIIDWTGSDDVSRPSCSKS